jgi:hypothetical protein
MRFPRCNEVQVVATEAHEVVDREYVTHPLSQRICPIKTSKAELPSHIWQFGFHCEDLTTAT